MLFYKIERFLILKKLFDLHKTHYALGTKVWDNNLLKIEIEVRYFKIKFENTKIHFSFEIYWDTICASGKYVWNEKT